MKIKALSSGFLDVFGIRRVGDDSSRSLNTHAHALYCRIVSGGQKSR